MDLQLEGRLAVITGGSGGIGAAVARALLAEGAEVVLVGRTAETLDATAAALGGRVHSVVCDTGSDDDVRRMAEQVIAEHGAPSILVNTAARPNRGGIPEEDLEVEINVKVRGYLRTTRAFLPGMVDAGWGRVINVGGGAARYTGSLVGTIRNAAVTAMTKNLADEVGSTGVNVVAVHPGLTVTDALLKRFEPEAASLGVSMDELLKRKAANVSIGRLVTADEVATVVAFLASPVSVAINGDSVVAGGGAKGPIYY